MFSGCADNQTSADTSIAGASTGAMSYAFLRTIRANPQQSYIEVLQNTRQWMAQSYQQIPQLSVGGEYDLRQPVYVSAALERPNNVKMLELIIVCGSSEKLR